MGRLPNFVIIGAMKSATSTLYEQLQRQPGIFLPELKEPNFFSDQYARGWDWYAGLFAEARASDIVGEASTHYTKLPTYPETVSRMWDHLPDAHLIYVMRDPIDRLVSQYIHQLKELLQWNIDLPAQRRQQTLPSCRIVTVRSDMRCHGRSCWPRR